MELNIDGSTDKCSMTQDINFQFTGFGVVGKVELELGFLLQIIQIIHMTFGI